MPFGIWEELSAVRLDRDQLPPEAWSLLRGRIFGPGGDLEVRRQGARFQWRLIGPGGMQLAAAPNQGEDFWAEPSNAKQWFYRSEATFLLWGEGDGKGRWHEDRVGAAQLAYPVNASWGRVQIRARLFCRNGQVEFVWYQGLEEHHGDRQN